MPMQCKVLYLDLSTCKIAQISVKPLIHNVTIVTKLRSKVPLKIPHTLVTAWPQPCSSYRSICDTQWLTGMLKVKPGLSLKICFPEKWKWTELTQKTGLHMKLLKHVSTILVISLISRGWLKMIADTTALWPCHYWDYPGLWVTSPLQLSHNKPGFSVS